MIDAPNNYQELMDDLKILPDDNEPGAELVYSKDEILDIGDKATKEDVLGFVTWLADHDIKARNTEYTIVFTYSPPLLELRTI